MGRKVLDERIGQFKDIEVLVGVRWNALAPVLDERRRRLWAGAEAKAIGRGGIAVVARATRLDRDRIAAGMRELETVQPDDYASPPQAQRVRRPGGGRPPVTETDATLVADLEALIEPTRRGDPESPLRWTTLSTRNLASALREKGHRVGSTTVALILNERGYSLQANKKTVEGKQHPDRDAQFHHINDKVANFVNGGLPVVSTDTKKKELIGNFKNGGQEWRPKGKPTRVNCHDFPQDAFGKAIPYGVYDLIRNEAYVNIGVDHDTPRFAVASIETWWNSMGSKAYPEARELLVTADAGGSNGYRSRVWKLELQRLSDATGLTIHVCHFPPGTSKWNRIEHSLFSAISLNWRGRPLTTYETVVKLIGATTNTSGLRVKARVDRRAYATGIKVNKGAMAALNMLRDDFHGEWNYTIAPRQ